MMLFCSTAKSANSRSKWRASSRTALSRLSRPLSMAFWRKRSTVSAVPIAVAAISTKPPTISHVSGALCQRRSTARIRAVHRIDAPIQPSRGMQDAAKLTRPGYQQRLGKYEWEQNQGVGVHALDRTEELCSFGRFTGEVKKPVTAALPPMSALPHY